MAILIKSRIEIADRHTTLCAFGVKAKTKPALQLGDSAGYTDLYQRVENAAGTGGLDYQILSGHAGKILETIRPVYKNNKYWRRYLQSDARAENMWAAALPLHAGLLNFIDVLPPAGFTAKISPVPSVLIYPFGWSAWISLRITGDHTLEELAALEAHIFTKSCIQAQPAPAKPVSLQAFLDEIAAGIRNDAFCGGETRDTSGTDKAVVITVLEKKGATLSLGILDPQTQDRLKRMIRPEGALSRRSFDQLIFRVDSNDSNYIVMDGLGRFIWMDRLLLPEHHNHQWLNCYHHNSFMALAQAWQLEGLLREARKLKSNRNELEDLLTAARNVLEFPEYKNASLHGFLEQDSVKKLL